MNWPHDRAHAWANDAATREDREREDRINAAVDQYAAGLDDLTPDEVYAKARRSGVNVTGKSLPDVYLDLRYRERVRLDRLEK